MLFTSITQQLSSFPPGDGGLSVEFTRADEFVDGDPAPKPKLLYAAS